MALRSDSAWAEPSLRPGVRMLELVPVKAKLATIDAALTLGAGRYVLPARDSRQLGVSGRAGFAAASHPLCRGLLLVSRERRRGAERCSLAGGEAAASHVGTVGAGLLRWVDQRFTICGASL